MSKPIPVDRLTILLANRRLSFDIPFDTFPDGMQSRLDALDSNDDGEITYTPEPGGSAEVVHSNDSFDQLYRLLWGYAGASPHNERFKDRATLPSRSTAIQTLQKEVFETAVSLLIKKDSKPEDFQLAKRTLELSGDYANLHAVGLIAWGRWVKTKDLAYARVAEDFQISAMRHASALRSGYSHFPLIEQELGRIRPVLDEAETKLFSLQTQQPYLLAGPKSPITADLEILSSGGQVFFAVAVPERWIKTVRKRGEAVPEALRHYFNSIEAPSIRRSAFQDSADGKEFPLIATTVEEDLAGPEDDRLDRQSSYHLDQRRLNRTLFKGKKMVYYRVGFELPAAEKSLDARRLARFDLILRMTPSKNGEAGRVREIPNCFVLQNLSEGPSRTLILSDTHVTQREWETVPVMATSLMQDAEAGNAAAADQAEEIERFFQPTNELVIGALESGNEAFRHGKIDRVFVTGDLVDNVNAPVSTELLNYHDTNVRTSDWIFSRTEAPFYAVSGNHDHVGPPRPLSKNPRNFVFVEGLKKLYEEHYDGHRFSGSLLWNAIKRISTRPCPDGDDACFVLHTLQDTYSDGLHDTPNDPFLTQFLRNAPYETFGFHVGHGVRLFGWPTEDEHLNYGYYLIEEAEDPVREDLLERGVQYLKKLSPYGKGPQPENFVAWLQELRAAQENGWKVVPFGHYPAFARDFDKKYEELDTMTPRTAWAVRQVSFYYRFTGKGEVLPLAIAGHVHHYEAAVFDFEFLVLAKLLHSERHQHLEWTDEQLEGHLEEEAEKLKAQYLEEVGKVLAAPEPDSVYEKLEELRKKWHLDDIMVTRRVGKLGSDGLPDPLVEEFNQDSLAFTKKYGTLFLNSPAAGPPSQSSTGAVVRENRADGSLKVELRFHRLTHDQQFKEVSGKKLAAFRKAWWQEVRDWDPAMEMKDFQALPSKTKVETIGPRGYREKASWEFLPLIYQYSKKKVGLNLNLQSGYGYVNGEFRPSLSVGGELRLPLANRANLTVGGPNYLALGGGYDFLKKEPSAFAGLDFGLLRTDFTVEFPQGGDAVMGGRALFHSILPGEAGISLAAGSDLEGNWRATANLNLSLTLFTRRPRDRFEP